MTPIVYDSKKQTYQEVSQEYGRLLTAAVISAQFRKLLLTNPGKAISAGFGGEAFYLDTENRNRVASIRASNLVDFATQLTSVVISPVMGYSAVAGD
jgi:hypothetical protein